MVFLDLSMDTKVSLSSDHEIEDVPAVLYLRPLKYTETISGNINFRVRQFLAMTTSVNKGSYSFRDNVESVHFPGGH